MLEQVFKFERVLQDCSESQCFDCRVYNLIMFNTCDYGMLSLLCCTLTLTLSLFQCTSISDEGTILLRIKDLDWNDSHYNLSAWNASHHNPCAWNGISCNRQNAITTVNLTNALISGNLTSAICSLPNLTGLILEGNYLGGPFPEGLFECKRLRVLDLSKNLFAGCLPSRIHELRELRVLNLAGNSFSGNVPAGFGVLPKIQQLYFHENHLNGTVPACLGNLTTLVSLNMADNPLHPGAIPRELGNLKRLRLLYLYNCSLLGKIPDFFGNLTHLEELDMSINQLSGNIPTTLRSLSNLRVLYLNWNNLSGQIPSGIGEIRSLSDLDLSNNSLSGKFPKSIANLTYLEALRLNDNGLTGPIPTQLGKMQYLSVLVLFTNKLTGWLPQNLGTHSNIAVFDVSENELEGPLPKNLCSGNQLWSFGASENNFSGSLPFSLENCSSLEYLSVHNNQLSGEIPAALWSVSDPIQVFVQDNKFEGQISAAIGRAKNLLRLKINNNRLSGRIPQQVGQLRKLERFIASNNEFSGPIPHGLGGLSSIVNLGLDHNFLSGEIPKELTKLKKLSQLNLSNNQLTGKIPPLLGYLPALNSLDLSSNSLYGVIPSQLGSLRLTFFNVSGNRLSGPIPDTLDNLFHKESFLANPGLCGSRNLMLRSCSSSSDKLLSKRLATALLTHLLFAAVALCFICLCFFRNLRRRKPNSNPSWKLTSFHSSELDESYILRNLTDSNVIGCGSAAKVYKVTLHNGQDVAVKKIQKGGQENKEMEVDVEVDTLGLIRHTNILKLLGCICSEESDFKLLVYEYMSNGSLLEHLRDVELPEMVLQWPIRYSIALGAARGLSYMHHHCSPPILHRDVKSSSILLDGDFLAKIADFGISREIGKLGDEYYVSGYVGSHGYIAPEYVERLKVSEKSDVYSFGMVLLELVSGKKVTGEAEFGEGFDIVGWILNTIWMGRGETSVLDWRILDENSIEQMVRVLRVGLVCTYRSPEMRPSMKEVVEMLIKCNTEEQGRENMVLASGASPSFSTTPHSESENEVVSFSY